ncbi:MULTISPECIES: chemotaxis protein CheW [unclassified Duganella]|uniref:chemotaxis protein CheW n=1 Tax=unclassified Duganella TaxID=2636909 RepID=UPI000E350099|nr:MULTISPECIES: chemotaxis protein CheW [unclassified Duganella]RFP13541.1 chemotaxis protein CheW [Duganella sp. BJB475]RFP36250.1 chemotaxis protein CheW [Duganella sp. BJB476]
MHATNSAAAPATELFGSFVLEGDEFALPAICIREVVNYPAKISVLPLSPAFLEGVFTLRGVVIPVVNLGRVFRPEARAAEASDKIAILDFQGVLVGILFHETGEILRVRPEQRSNLSYANGDVHGVVAGTILLDDGARLVQVLDPAALVRIENVPQVLALQGAQRQTARRNQGERRQCVSFRVGTSSFAFEMSAIQEIIRVPELQASVLNSALCLGRINFRGSQVAVVDFSTLLNSNSAPAPAQREFLPDQRIVIARIDDATIGFLVDSVDNIVNFYSEEVMAIPLLSKARAGMFGGCISKPELGDIIFLNHHEIFSSNEIKEMRAGHASLYPKDEAAKTDRDPRRSQRQVYITFALENTYAVEIKQVREIIDFSGDITRPPGMPAFMRGMLNLRQQMISVIDLRSLYHMPQLDNADQAKILIVERGEDLYGLMVDAVENIMTISDSRRFAAPKILRNPGVQGDPRSEMDEVIDIEGEGDSHKTLSVFECDRLLQRLARELPALAA